MTVTHPILAADFWPSNASLIADIHELNYIRNDDIVLDMTYGDGLWWKRFRPVALYTNDLDPDLPTDYHYDFRQTLFDNGAFDVVAYDPPYVSVGGRDTSTIKDFLFRYGLYDAMRTPKSLNTYIVDGLKECFRVVNHGGIVLVKCKDYISSGDYFPGTHYVLNAALASGAVLVDRFEMIGSPGAQSQDSQVHARRNLSSMFVFRGTFRKPPSANDHSQTS